MIKSTAYQASYTMKKLQNTESPGIYEFMLKMLSSDKPVEITKASHFPICLLHKKYRISSQVRRSGPHATLAEIKNLKKQFEM